MSVTSVGQTPFAPQYDRPGPQLGRAGGPQQGKASPPAESTERVATSEAGGDDREPGVVRLLREGHFKGVADVRLRMNFADHFTKSAAAEQQADIASTAENMLATLHDKLDELPEEVASTEPAQQAVSNFEQQLANLPPDADAESGERLDALQVSRQAVIETLREALLTETETEAGPTETPADDVAHADADPMATWLSELDAALGDLIEKLQAAPANPMEALPPLSEPNGQGTAYNKFLAQYQQMFKLQHETEPAEDVDPPAAAVEASVDLLA
ncbi:hypothetical protein ACERK3_08015 [Phycisphaerales bacterium AB-hyl4]|uniref:Uncharacterized protein n=1 Tax=Natronomicrosphaera hydrolytica TaxID=3242702 RepID=A0ABV4U4Z7_9BACT